MKNSRTKKLTTVGMLCAAAHGVLAVQFDQGRAECGDYIFYL